MTAPQSARPAYAALAWSAAMLALFAATSAAMFRFDLLAVLGGISFSLLLLFMAAIGALIARHDPAQPVGWLFSLCAALVTTSIGSGSWAQWAGGDAHLPGAVWGFWLALWPWAVGLIGFMMLLPLLFPDGRPQRRWRWLLRADLAALAAMTAVLMVQPIAVSDDDGKISNPLGVSGADSVWVAAPLVATVVAVIVRGAPLRKITRRRL